MQVLRAQAFWFFVGFYTGDWMTIFHLYPLVLIGYNKQPDNCT